MKEFFKGLVKDRQSILKTALFGALILAEVAIYVAFIIIQTPAYDPIYLKYAGILLCGAVSATSIYFFRKDGIIMTVALVFTAISDLFILVLRRNYEVGLSTFIIVQLTHFVRIYLINGKKPWISLGVRLGVIVAALITMGALGKLNALIALVCIYFPNLVANVVDSAFLIKISKKYILYFIGLLLFLGCDIFVGLCEAQRIGLSIIPANLDFFAHLMIWLFYLPAQTCIVSSVTVGAEYKPFFVNKPLKAETVQASGIKENEE
ncbi:MAG: hypothetical protein K2L67_04400 [Clostridia bacterium]|nr:hypothetical protein [Clostridia bacterium]